jgi:hypothetical protein
LPILREQWQAARVAATALACARLLHKLKAGCGFVWCGAAGSGGRCTAVAPLDPQVTQLFEFAVDDALDWRDDQS